MERMIDMDQLGAAIAVGSLLFGFGFILMVLLGQASMHVDIKIDFAPWRKSLGSKEGDNK